ncbi:hypothetical protein Tco_0403388 [Tanacetum coccineum]
MLATRGSGKVTTKEAQDNKTKGHKVPIAHITWPINKKAYTGSLPLTPTTARNQRTLTCDECRGLGHYKCVDMYWKGKAYEDSSAMMSNINT